MATAAFRPPPNIDPITGLPTAPMIPGMPGLPAYPGIAGVAELFDPNFGRTETITLGAENAIAGGFGMGGFAQNQTNRLLDSERKANFLAGHQILEPYLQRDFQGAQNAADRQARMNQIAAEGAQALQRLQLSEAGEGQRLTQREEAEARRQAVAGQQAMQQLTLQEAGDTSRQRSQIQGQLAGQVLGAALADRRANANAPVGGSYYLNNSGLPGGGTPGGPDPRTTPRPYTPTLGLGSTSIDQLLRKYGLI